MKEVFQLAWATPRDDAEINWNGEEETARLSAWSILETYFQQTRLPVEDRPEGVEVGVEADLGSHGLPTLIGVLDLVRAGGGIVDFKTAARSPVTEMLAHTSETQVTAYSVLYREATGQTESGIELHHLIKTKTPQVIVTTGRAALISLVQQDGGYVVLFAYGRRGTTLQTGTKTTTPLTCDQAKETYDKLVAGKMAKGYTPGANGTPYQQTEKAARVSGILPQLLNPIVATPARQLLDDSDWCVQENQSISDGAAISTPRNALSPSSSSKSRRRLELSDQLAAGRQDRAVSHPEFRRLAAPPKRRNWNVSAGINSNNSAPG